MPHIRHISNKYFLLRSDGYFAAGKGSPGIVHAAAAATSTKVPTTFSHIDQFAVSTATFVGGYSSSAANAAANAAVAAAAAAAATAACTNSTSPGCDIQQHLQSMFSLLRKEETLKMVGFSPSNFHQHFSHYNYHL